MANNVKKLGDFFKEHRKIVLTVLGLILVGIVISAATVSLEKLFHKSGESAAELGWWQALLLTVMDHAGVGLFAAAILGVLIELPHMHEYFQERIQNTIINRTFIKQLSKPAQERLQEQALAAFFGVEELSQETGFYKFYREKIRQHIGGPYRTDTRFGILVEPFGTDYYKVTETISFTCKRGGEAILPEAGWTTERDEIEKLLKLEITAQRPDGNGVSDVYCFDAESNTCHHLLTPNPAGYGHTLSLAEYASADGLIIRATVIYIVSRERPFPWGMRYLSQGFSGEIHFPADLQIFVDLFGMDEKAFPKDKTNLPRDERGFSVCKVKHDDWLLPDDGFSFHFQQKKASVTAAAPAPSYNGR